MIVRLVNGTVLAGVSVVERVWGKYLVSFSDAGRPPMELPADAIERIWEA